MSTTSVSRRYALLFALMALLLLLVQTDPVARWRVLVRRVGPDGFTQTPASCSGQALQTGINRTEYYIVYGVFECAIGTTTYGLSRRAVPASGQCSAGIIADCTPWYSDPSFMNVGSYHRWEQWSHSRQTVVNPSTLSHFCFTVSDDQFLYAVPMKPCSACPQYCPEPPTPYYCDEGYFWDTMTCLCTPSPIIVDTRHDGYDLTAPDEGVAFRFAPAGRVVTASWTGEGADDALLVWDRNGTRRSMMDPSCSDHSHYGLMAREPPMASRPLLTQSETRLSVRHW